MKWGKNFMGPATGGGVEVGSERWLAYQAGTSSGTDGGTKARALLMDELQATLSVLKEKLAERKAQEARFVEYAAETEAYKERRRRRETKNILDWWEGILSAD